MDTESANNLLYKACGSGDVGLAQTAIQQGADEWDLGLMFACEGGHIALAQLMIAKGAVDWNWGLASACGRGHLPLAHLMVLGGFFVSEYEIVFMVHAYKNFIVSLMQSSGMVVE